MPYSHMYLALVHFSYKYPVPRPTPVQWLFLCLFVFARWWPVRFRLHVLTPGWLRVEFPRIIDKQGQCSSVAISYLFAARSIARGNDVQK